MASPYQYQPFRSPAAQIRLLELLPGRGIIQCRLKTIDLNDAKGTYEPISYCWKAYTRKHWWGVTYKEKRQKTFQIQVDGAGLYISESLQVALRQLRLKTRVRLLWADAICINQADDNEKSVQVAIMGEIYRAGKQTVVWLGDANCWTGRAFRFLKLVSSQVSEASDSPELCNQPEDESNYSRGDGSAKGPRLRHLKNVWASFQDRISHLALRSVLCRPYFERAWIVQEVVLSGHAVVMCGKHTITGSTMRKVLYSLKGSSFSPDEIALIEESFGDLQANRELYCLDTIISKLSYTKASDPRDKLYSALGLHQNCKRCGSVIVDYSKDIDSVFLDATKILLSRSPYLDILSMSYGSSRPDRIPSWVWNPEPRSTEFDFSRADADASNLFQASQRWHSRPQFQGRMLGLLGYVFDKVRAVGDVLPQGYESRTQFLGSIRCYFSWVDVSGIYEQGITDTEAKVRICAFRCTVRPLSEKFSGVKTWYSNWYDEEGRNFDVCHAELMKHFSRFFLPGAKKQSIRAKLGLWAAIEPFWLQLNWNKIFAKSWVEFVQYRYSSAVFGRRFVRTETGGYGMCPPDTKPNDRLVLLQGANVPIVLRPSGKNWILVGECFVYGVMYGERWDQDRCEMLWIE